MGISRSGFDELFVHLVERAFRFSGDETGAGGETHEKGKDGKGGNAFHCVWLMWCVKNESSYGFGLGMSQRFRKSYFVRHHRYPSVVEVWGETLLFQIATL